MDGWNDSQNCFDRVSKRRLCHHKDVGQNSKEQKTVSLKQLSEIMAMYCADGFPSPSNAITLLGHEFLGLICLSRMTKTLHLRFYTK